MRSHLAEQITEIPEHFVAGNKSTAALLKDAGFPEDGQFLSVDDVVESLQGRPRLVDLWFERAGDQRLAGGWGIERENGAYRICSYADGKCLGVGDDRTKACAEFIVRYISFVAEALASPH